MRGAEFHHLAVRFGGEALEQGANVLDEVLIRLIAHQNLEERVEKVMDLVEAPRSGVGGWVGGLELGFGG